jgi:ACR3 family arsenite transporter
MGLFERFLSVWVGMAILLGGAAGHGFPALFEMIAAFTWAHVNLVVAVFIWAMI